MGDEGKAVERRGALAALLFVALAQFAFSEERSIQEQQNQIRDQHGLARRYARAGVPPHWPAHARLLLHNK